MPAPRCVASNPILANTRRSNAMSTNTMKLQGEAPSAALLDQRDRSRRGSASPVTMTIPATTDAYGLSRSATYRLLGEGKLRAVKHGSRTLILTESLREYFASLPPAKFR